jgi:hypothetical protein
MEKWLLLNKLFLRFVNKNLMEGVERQTILMAS